MKEIITYEASDGKQFHSKEECKKYEESVIMAIYNDFIGLSIDGQPFPETVIWEDYGYGNENWEMIVVEIKDENDLKIANMFADMQDSRMKFPSSSRFTSEHIGKRLLVAIGSSYEPNCHIWGTEEEVIEGFKKDIAPFFKTKEELENNESV